MIKHLSPEDWDQGQVGIHITNLLFHLDYCLFKKRMSVTETERYILTSVMNNPGSTLRITHNYEMPRAITVSYVDASTEHRVGFTSTIPYLYTMRIKVMKSQEKSNESKESPTQS